MISATRTTTLGTSEASTWANFLRETVCLEYLSCRDAWGSPLIQKKVISLPLKGVCSGGKCVIRQRSSGRGSSDCTASEITKRARPCRFKSLKHPGILKEGQDQSVHVTWGNGDSHNGEDSELMASGTRRKIAVPWADVQLPNRFSALKENTKLGALYTTKHQTSTWAAASDTSGETDSCKGQSFCLREICFFCIARIRDAIRELPRCVSPSDYLTLQYFHLSTNGYSKRMPRACQVSLCGFWNEGQGHRKPGGFSPLPSTLFPSPLRGTNRSCISTSG